MRRQGRDDRGAAAVEFALVVPVLVLLVFGIIDYGLYFANTLGARSGVREAARQGIVQNYAAGDCSGVARASGPSATVRRLACLAVKQTGATAGDTYARVQAPDGWNMGDSLLVCVVITDQGVTGYAPLPDGGTTRTALQMRIEQDNSPRSSAAGFASTAGSTTPPGGWSWCA